MPAPLPLPSSFSTRLAAVNVLLAGIGEQPVENLASESSLAQIANNTLDEVHRATLTKGWWFNREEKFPLTPNELGEVLLPVDALEVKEAYWSGDRSKDLVERGRRIYNKTDHTYTFSAGTVEVDLLRFLAWEEIPEVARVAILYHALRLFQIRELTSTAIERVAEESVTAAYVTLQQKEDEQAENNNITGNRDQVLNDYGPRRRR